MKKILILILIFSQLVVFSQVDTTHIHRFKNGKISTVTWLNNNREGKAQAFNKKGEIIYESHVRKFAGSAYVIFKHYDSGAVKYAYYSSHPDAGIQWYRKETWFSEEGTITDEKIDDHDGISPVLRIPTHINPTHYTDPTNPIQPNIPPDLKKIEEEKKRKQKEELEKKKKQQEVAVCASIHQNKVEIINHSRFQILLTIIHRNEDSTLTLQPGEKTYAPTYISAEISSPVNQNMNIKFSAKRRKRKKLDKVIETKLLEQYKTLHIVHIFESEMK